MHAVLNANYLTGGSERLLPGPVMIARACTSSSARAHIEGSSARALDVSKRLIDYGFHPPTNYFPLIVREALMIEPTETESKPTLDAFVAAMRKIAEEAMQQSGAAALGAACHAHRAAR